MKKMTTKLFFILCSLVCASLPAVQQAHASQNISGPFANCIDDKDDIRDNNFIDGLHLGMTFREAQATHIRWYPTGKPGEFSNEPPNTRVEFPKVTVRFKENIMTRILVYTDSEAMARQLSVHALRLIGDTFKDVVCEEDTRDTLYGPEDYMWIYTAQKGDTYVNLDVDDEQINFGIVMQYDDSHVPT